LAPLDVLRELIEIINRFFKIEIKITDESIKTIFSRDRKMKYLTLAVIFLLILIGLGSKYQLENKKLELERLKVEYQHQENMEKLELEKQKLQQREEFAKKAFALVEQRGGKIKLTNSGVEVEIPSQK